MDNTDWLKLDNQVCFPLYSAANAVVRAYRPLLKELDLTYLQYIAMMILWEEQEINVKRLGERMFLDSGTLTPLLKRLESKAMVNRKRGLEDERERLISLTAKGAKLKALAKEIPVQLTESIQLTLDEALQLKQICQKLLVGSTSKEQTNATN